MDQINANQALLNRTESGVLVRIRSDLTGKPKAAFVVSRAIAGTQLSQDVTEALSGYELPIFQSRTYQRVVYANAAASGLSVLEAEPASSAGQEIKALLKELQEFGA